MKANFSFQSFLAIALLIPLSGCIFLMEAQTSGEDKWSLGVESDSKVSLSRRAMKNQDGKEEASSRLNMRLNQGLLDADNDDSADPSSQ